MPQKARLTCDASPNMADDAERVSKQSNESAHLGKPVWSLCYSRFLFFPLCYRQTLSTRNIFGLTVYLQISQFNTTKSLLLSRGLKTEGEINLAFYSIHVAKQRVQSVLPLCACVWRTIHNLQAFD